MNIYVYVAIGVVVLLILFGLAIVNHSGENLVGYYEEYLNIYANLTPPQFAQIISERFFGGTLRITATQQYLGDCYYNRTIAISEKHFFANSLSGLTIVAHELGHAIQELKNPQKMQKFKNQILTSKFLSKLTFPLLIGGIVALLFEFYVAIALFALGVFTFIVALLVKISTIKIEKEASDIAMELLTKYAYLSEQELIYAKTLLDSAKLTYIASLLRSMLKWTMLTRKF